MSEYFFLITSLPTLTLGVKPEITFAELKDRLSMNLTAPDAKKVDALIWPIDLENIRALWMGYPLDDRGTFGPKQLEEALLVREAIPVYLIEFLDRYESVNDRLHYFPSLYTSMYHEMLEIETGFLFHYFQLEREVRLILTGLRAKQFHRDLAVELQFEDPTDSLVAYVLAQKDSPDFVPPPEYEELKPIAQLQPKQMQQALLEFKIKKIEELEEMEHFSIDRVLAYLAKFLLIDSWEKLDEDAGHMLIKNLSERG